MSGDKRDHGADVLIQESLIEVLRQAGHRSAEGDAVAKADAVSAIVREAYEKIDKAIGHDDATLHAYLCCHASGALLMMRARRLEAGTHFGLRNIVEAFSAMQQAEMLAAVKILEARRK